ncbi:zinc finger CCCH-type with G patch domain-containing protein isoform X1 [Dendroctonus ponderosae]|uniref:zinc finger CCCH-type with G patch domain-containing protein isoform X1 n=1 Tax=Dendroctonus ponderosae TaxID=77166 RepID=UPI0020357F99|nr:zinc finger CCCH-type with G patch domain-containing protein isoform X1 [Dendroctonus ponderosae]XP_048524505.1 zinc finger CCCH-type with G patch domain-containing protein isoform X1 [Dendroctonus ponderosae]XP_048524506.1 zinc finger CCCH-type with G patch domain-containing protein isoform X1 [Dendroctonus ponderosae]KAH1013112.1 hypothetical protein HUJ05_012154 [Dendroctonus ponderosae]
MDTHEEYYQQLQVINQLLEQTPEGQEKNELKGLKENIEELLALTNPSPSTDDEQNNAVQQDREAESIPTNEALDDEYARFMAEVSEEGRVDISNATEDSQVLETTNPNHNNNYFKDLEGKKFRAPHHHHWGQLTYHNAMVCSVPDEISNPDDLQVKVLFLNPTHTEMLPCPYYFDCEKDCRFSDEQCRFSHGELVAYSSLQDYIEPKFEHLIVGSAILAKQADDLWYRAKITKILEEKCLVRFDSKSVNNDASEEIAFKHILPLENYENGDSDDVIEESEDEENLFEKAQTRQQIIDRSLMQTPGPARLGDWEKYTKGIGSRLMQKMGYIVGTGLGKEAEGIVNPVSIVILPQGKSLDFCMNLKEERNNPELFHADQQRVKSRKFGQNSGRRRVKAKINPELLELEGYIEWHFQSGKKVIEEKESSVLRDKLKTALDKAVNVASFMLDERIKTITFDLEELKIQIRQLEDKHQEPKSLYKKLSGKETDLKRLNIFRRLVQSELDRRKNNKEMAVF